MRSQKAYLLIGVYSVLMFIGSVMRGLIARELKTTSNCTYSLFFSLLFTMVSGLFALNAIFQLFNQKKDWRYFGIMLASLFAISSFFIFYDQAANIILMLAILYGLEFIGEPGLHFVIIVPER